MGAMGNGRDAASSSSSWQSVGISIKVVDNKLVNLDGMKMHECYKNVKRFKLTIDDDCASILGNIKHTHMHSDS